MPIDSQIALGVRQPQVESPLNQLANVLQIQGAQQQSEFNNMKMREAEQGMARKNKMLSLLGGVTTDEERMGALRGGGFFDEADKLDKSLQDRSKTKSDVDKNTFDVAQKRYNLNQQGDAALINMPNLTRDAVIADYQKRVAFGVMPQELFQKAIEFIPNDPAQLREQLLQSAKSQLTPEQIFTAFAPKPTEVSDNQRKFFRDTNPNSPTFGKEIAGTSMQMQTSPGERLTDERTRSEGSLNRGVTLRGQNLTDARLRDTNSINTELKDLQLAKAKDEQTSRNNAKDAGISSVSNQIAVLDKALTHPGRSTATGLSGYIDPRNVIPGTDAVDFKSVLDQIQGAAFLQAFEALKGGGQITEVEGKKATDAIARLSRTQSDSEFTKSLNDLRDVMTTGYKRLSGNDYTMPSNKKPSVSNW